MKKVLLLIFLVISLFASVEKEISKYSKDLLNINSNYEQMDGKLADIAKKIVSAKKKRVLINQDINSLEKEIAAKRKLHQKSEKLYVQTKNELEELTFTKKEIEIELRDMIAKEFGLMVALENQNIKTKDSFIDSYVYDITSKYTNKKIKQLNEQVIEIALKQDSLQRKNKKYKAVIAEMQTKQKKLASHKSELDKLIANLNKSHNTYEARLKRIENEKDELASTLNKLKIVAKEEKQKKIEAQKEAQRQKELERTATSSTASAPALERHDVNYKVRQIGSSYHQDNLYRYRGPKTISPIENAKVVRGFGTYTDPIYKIKIFNESIVLKAPKNPSNVRTVLNGEILYAQETNMLGKVVIVKHSGDMHTIYAGLSKIAPGIQVGKKIAKGYVLGRVHNELTFEATKNSRHLNPSRLISLR